MLRGGTVGRWPANLIHDGSEEVLELFPETKSGALSPDHNRTKPKGNGITHGVMAGTRESFTRAANSGSAARFFYCSKASTKERGEGCSHPTIKPLALMRYLCRLVAPINSIILDPFMGSGSTGIAALQEQINFIGIELQTEYIELAKHRITEAGGEAVIVKPVIARKLLQRTPVIAL
jgi:site-specific DNA-methyltransferase (adenine-specific)